MARELNTSQSELGHFNRLASRWWDPCGEFRTLHDLNPVRLAWLEEQAGGLATKRVVDVGCGGGLLAEAMARAGATVTGIDMSPDALAVARLHLMESQLQVDYQQTTGEELAEVTPGSFDVVSCMELLEHVPDPARLVHACARLSRPGGSVMFSTINRTLKAFATAIVGAEYLTELVPRGTHRYAQLIRPSELDSWGRAAGLELKSLTGGSYNPASRVFSLGAGPAVNYFAHFRTGTSI